MVQTSVRRHPVYWFNDGSVIIRVHDDDEVVVLFKIHESLLRRHARLVLERDSDSSSSQLEGEPEVPMVTVPPALGIQVQDFVSLLAHLYHDASLSPQSPFPHVAAVLRASSAEQLDMPPIHALARSCLIALFPGGPVPFVHLHPTGHLEEALGLTWKYNLSSIRKGIYYNLVTTTDVAPDTFESSIAADDGQTPNVDAIDFAEAKTMTDLKTPETTVTKNTTLTPTDIERCRNLVNGVVTHFASVLFEPPVTSHMPCTQLLGDKWFPLVVQSAITSSAADGIDVCKPLEALEQLKRMDWAAEGLCPACIRERKEVWTNEQNEIWERMDDWLEL